MITPYQMCINNVAQYIVTHRAGEAGAIDAFAATTTLAIAFCTNKEQTMNDLLVAGGKIIKESNKLKKSEEDSRCPECGGRMQWCESCQQWTRTCCVEFGTCQCS